MKGLARITPEPSDIELLELQSLNRNTSTLIPELHNLIPMPQSLLRGPDPASRVFLKVTALITFIRLINVEALVAILLLPTINPLGAFME